MTILKGLNASFEHPQNGITLADMEAARRATRKLGDVIIFRSTGPWAMRWLDQPVPYPSKNFHVKGKSSDWGPHAGLVPFDGVFSKVGYDVGKANKGTKANLDGLHSRFAWKTPLVLGPTELHMQKTLMSAGRLPISRSFPIPGSDDEILVATMSGSTQEVAFRALKLLDGRFEIRAFYPGTTVSPEALRYLVGLPLEVMTSNEVGAQNRPMTGDYDLLAVCPRLSDYGSLSSRQFLKPGIHVYGKDPLPDFVFAAGIGMDNVIDPSLQTGGTVGTNYKAARAKGAAMREERGLGERLPPAAPLAETAVDEDGVPFARETVDAQALGRQEHPDMGNLTPRILRAILELNVQMGAVDANAPLRRVHHNAESHRNAAFGALTKNDMLTMKDGEVFGDGFPLTAFHPPAFGDSASPASLFGEVCTIETFEEFGTYCTVLRGMGFYMPKNWAWELTKSVGASRAVNSLIAGFQPRTGSNEESNWTRDAGGGWRAKDE